MTLPIQTYNRGFGKFGPLESCNDGELMKSEDVYYYTRSMEQTLQNRRADDIIKIADSYLQLLDAKTEEIKDLREGNTLLETYVAKADDLISSSHERINYWSDLYFKGLETNWLCIGVAGSVSVLNIILIVKIWVS